MVLKVYISVIIPCYNTNYDHFCQMADSLFAVKDKIEVIIVDDSTSNPVGNYFTHCFSCFPKKKYFKNEKNEGLFYSYRKGVIESTGSIICSLDHDDLAHIDIIVDDVIRMFKDGYNYIYTDEYKFDDKGKQEIFLKPNIDISSILYYFYTHHFTFYEGNTARKVVSKQPKYPVYSAFDIWFYLNYIKALGSSLKFFHIKERAYGWRVHDGSTSKSITQKPMHVLDRIRIAKDFFKDLDSNIDVSVRKDFPFILDIVYLDYIFAISKINCGRSIKNFLSKVPFKYLSYMGVGDFTINMVNENEINFLPEELRVCINSHLANNIPILTDLELDAKYSVAHFVSGRIIISDSVSYKKLKKQLVIIA